MQPTTTIYREYRSPGLLLRWLAAWLVSVVGIWFSDVLGLLTYGDKFGTLVVAGLVLATINTFVRPLLNVLSIPFIVLTLGFFMLVVSAFTLWITSELVGSFDLDGFWKTIGAAIILAIANALIGRPLKSGRFEETVYRDGAA